MKKNNGGIMRIKDIFTKANCDYLKSLGETDDDILQIKQAYKVLKWKTVTTKNAIMEIAFGKQRHQ